MDAPAAASLLRDRLQAALADTFVVERELGGGGMSRVYLATERGLGRRVVVKVLPPDLAAAVNIERFRREVQLVASLHHPHLVPVLNHGTVRVDVAGSPADLPWFTMPFVDGESLRERLARSGPLPVEDVLRYLGEVADALAFAHGRGIVHRDIKPGNILLLEGHALVTDFGVAKALATAAAHRGTPDALTSQGLAMGTPAYMAPEQAAADPAADHRVDLYALGCVAYECLTGAPPFAGLTPAATLAAHVTTPPPPVDVRRPDLPRAVVALVMALLAKQPDERPASAAVLRDHLRALASSGTTPVSTAALPVAARPPRRRGLLIGAAIGLAALAATGVGLTRQRTAAHSSPAALAARDRLIIADFTNRTGDSLLGTVMTEALRTDFSQSWHVTVISPDAVRGVLRRMQRPETSHLDLALAREVAVRDGAKAVVAGEIAPLGRQYLLSASLVAAKSGETITAVRETAASADELIAAADRLSKRLRERLGESLRSVQSDGPLQAVTTTSLEALRRYSLALQVPDSPDRYERTIPLLEQAVALDSTFAMAWRRLGVERRNQSRDTTGARIAFTRAYALRDRLGDRERLLTEGSYYGFVENDQAKARAAWEGVLALEPDNVIAAVNLSNQLSEQGEDERVRQIMTTLLASRPGEMLAYSLLINAQLRLGDNGGARETLARYVQRFPGRPEQAPLMAAILGASGELDSAETMLRATLARGELMDLKFASDGFARLLALRGRLAERERVVDRMNAAAQESNPARAAAMPLYTAIDRAIVDLLVRRRREQALARVEQALRRTPIERLPQARRPYELLLLFYALAEDAPKLRALAERTPFEDSEGGRRNRLLINAHLAGLAGAVDSAVAMAAMVPQRSPEGPDAVFLTASWLDRADRRADAIEAYRRYLSLPRGLRWVSDSWYLPRIYERLAVRLEETGDRAGAAAMLREFIRLWEKADPELQGRVGEAKAALRRIAAA